jgi:hypothetical protein
MDSETLRQMHKQLGSPTVESLHDSRFDDGMPDEPAYQREESRGISTAARTCIDPTAGRISASDFNMRPN